jgi:hypothetical protein
MYQLYTGLEIAEAIRVVRAEMTDEEMRHALQVEILERQKKLEELKMVK